MRLISCFSSSHSPSPKIFRPVLSIARQVMKTPRGDDQMKRGVLPSRGFAGNVSPFPRRDRVEKSGTAISAPSKRMRPRVWRNGCLKTTLRVRHTSIPRSEYVRWPPRVIQRGADHRRSASSLSQTVRSPRRQRLSLQSAQLVTLYFCFGILSRRSALNL